ncbi:MAG: YbaK/EbsC family protein [Succiniclasticum sp.]|jgi:prolyl-tRNA editing enzyme YbaK/EbsC (Cys-tRNA(Pro) deacylase)
MSVERARAYLAKFGQADRIITFPTSSATVELAAQAAGTEPCRIAKSMSFQAKEGPILIVTAGDTKIDNSKFKHFFGEKAKMLPFEEVEPAIGHAVGGVCPFGVNEGVRVYLDVSLRRFPTVFPAAGEANNAIELTPAELEQYTDNQGWIDVCKGWQQPAEA